MVVKTRVFDLCDGRYSNLTELARAMGLSVSQVYRVREGKRRINEKFILGAIKAFPQFRFHELFYIAPEDDSQETSVIMYYPHYRPAVPSR